MRAHEPLEWARVIRTVRTRIKSMTSRAQRLSETERSFYESAKRFLTAELALALEWTEKQAEGRLDEIFLAPTH